MKERADRRDRDVSGSRRGERGDAASWAGWLVAARVGPRRETGPVRWGRCGPHGLVCGPCSPGQGGSGRARFTSWAGLVQGFGPKVRLGDS